MDLLPTPEQDEIVATVRSQLERDFDLRDLADHDGADSVVDPDLWRRCAALGWFGLGLAADLGGVGYTLAEEALLFAELGAHATPGPFLATVLGARLAAQAGEAELAGSILAGERLVALAEPEGRAAISHTVTGSFRVTDHGGADVVLAIDPSGAAIVAAPDLRITPQPSIDPLVPLGVATADGVPALASTDDAGPLLLMGTVLVASELSGMAAATAAQSARYALDREQFGHPIGSFQAVKHRCADMAVRAEAATSLVRYAALAIIDGLDSAAFHTHAARAMSTDAAITNAQVNVQNHGGIGFTWEHTAHRFVTRSQCRSRTLGDRRSHLARLLDQPAPD